MAERYKKKRDPKQLAIKFLMGLVGFMIFATIFIYLLANGLFYIRIGSGA